MNHYATRIRPRRVLLASTLFAASLVAAALGSGSEAVHAAVGVGCDPIVTLSNGAVVHLTATIYDTPTDITDATYTMHAPVGTTVRSVAYPTDPNNIPQTFYFYADNPSGVWDSYTNVATKTSGVAVTATAQVANFNTFSASGLSNQDVHTHVVTGSGD